MARKDAQPGKSEAAAARRVKALDLRKAGASYRQIGAQLGVSEAQAFNDVKAALDALNKLEIAAAEDVRRLELERLDTLTLALWPNAKSGKEGAIDRILKLMERRAKLLGLDAPTKQELSGPDGEPLVKVYAGFDPDKV